MRAFIRRYNRITLRLPFFMGVAGIIVAIVAATTACAGWIPQSQTSLPDSTAIPTPVAQGGGVPTSLSTRLAYPTLTVTNSAAEWVFASDRMGAGDIFSVGPEGQLTNLTSHPAGDWDPTWSPTCADPTQFCRIAFTSHRSGDSEVWTMDPQGHNLRNISQHPAWDYWPAWSPDGQKVVFVSERDGDPELFVQPVDGQEAIQLTFNNDSDRLPVWSPDGSRIAFAAVRNGVEEIHIINADGSHERPVTSWPLKGTSPTWSPDGRRIGFVGWDQEDRPGIYIVGPEPEAIQILWEGTAWIGSLVWSHNPSLGDAEGWLLFTSWQDGNHEIYALPTSGGTPIRLTQHPAWDDFPAVRPGLPFSPIAIESPALELPRSPTTQDRSSSPRATYRFGVNIADLGKTYLVRDIGFGWAKNYVNWGTVEPEPGQYNWVDPDNIVTAFGDYGLQMLIRVHGTPDWAKPADTFFSHPPDDVADFARFMQALASRYKGQVAAYEIWNEPNLNYEWGYLEPDPAAYTLLLKSAYQAVKAVDPDALVVSGGLATTGDGSATATGDLVFLQGMYDAGARGYFDALGSHPYAFGRDPDYEDPWGLSLSRVVQQREVMDANGDADTPIWITEVGWVLHTSWNLVEHEAIAVDEDQQAAYLVRTIRKTREEWPWIQGLFLFNLDFGSVPWYSAAEPMRWYAILNPDRTPRPAYTNIKSQLLSVE